MNRTRSSTSLWRSVCLTLAALALVFKVAIPAGYMLAGEAEGAFPLIICTAQGAVVVDGAHGLPDNHKAETHESSCAFAGHGAAFVEPANQNTALFARVAYTASTPPFVREAAPGQGLAAPPLPARGPPHLI